MVFFFFIIIYAPKEGFLEYLFQDFSAMNPFLLDLLILLMWLYINRKKSSAFIHPLVMVLLFICLIWQTFAFLENKIYHKTNNIFCIFYNAELSHLKRLCKYCRVYSLHTCLRLLLNICVNVMLWKLYLLIFRTFIAIIIKMTRNKHLKYNTVCNQTS